MKVTGILEYLIKKMASIRADNDRKDEEIAMLDDEKERLEKEIAAIKRHENEKPIINASLAIGYWRNWNK